MLVIKYLLIVENKLFSKLRIFSDQSCVNILTETVHISCFYSHLLYGMCVEIFIMNRYISKSYTTTKDIIDRQYAERGAAVASVNYYQYYFKILFWGEAEGRMGLE